jgi:hypothetical protein
MALQTEQSLSSSLAHFLNLRPPKKIPNAFIPGAFVNAGQLWPADNPSSYSLKAIAALQAEALKGSSWNYPMLALACALAAKVPGADTACVLWLTLLKTKYGWMGAEAGTRDEGYWYFHFVSVCTMFRLGSPQLKVLAGEYLDLFKFWSVLGAPMTGQRSVIPGLDQYNITDETTDFLRGGALPGTHPPTFDRLMVQCIQPELRALYTRPLNNPQWLMMTPVVFYVSAKQAMVVIQDNVDSNTIACLVGVRDTTSLAPNRPTTWAPAPPWGVVDKKTGVVTRIRQQSDKGKTEITEPTSTQAGVVLYSSSIFKAESIVIPAGAKKYVLGNGTTAAIAA